MTSRLFIFLTLVFSLLQGQILPSVFLEGFLVILLIYSRGFKNSLPALFLAGIFLDLFQFKTLGLTSLIFTTIGGASWFMKDFIAPGKGIFLTCFTLAIILARSHFVFSSYSIINLLLATAIGLIAFNVFRPLINTQQNFEI